jgi:hypothetical protein
MSDSEGTDPRFTYNGEEMTAEARLRRYNLEDDKKNVSSDESDTGDANGTDKPSSNPTGPLKSTGEKKCGGGANPRK